MFSLSDPKNLTDQDKILFHKEYLVLVDDSNRSDEKEKVWRSLSEYFISVDSRTDFTFFYDYFHIYSDLNWKNVYRVDIEKFLTIVISRQSYIGILLGNDIYDVVLSYLDFNVFDEIETGKLYDRIKTAFLNSPCIVGKDKTGQVITFAELLKKIGDIQEKDSIQKAEFYTWFSNLVTIPDAYKDFFIVNSPEEIMEKIEGLHNFFKGVTGDKIFYIIQKYFHPGLFEQKLQVDEEIVEEDEDVEDQKMISYDSIKESINSRFPKDDQGQYQDIEGVFALLSELASEYEDPRIETLLYFDEKTGGFEWTPEESLLGDMDQNLDQELK